MHLVTQHPITMKKLSVKPRIETEQFIPKIGVEEVPQDFLKEDEMSIAPGMEQEMLKNFEEARPKFIEDLVALKTIQTGTWSAIDLMKPLQKQQNQVMDFFIQIQRVLRNSYLTAGTELETLAEKDEVATAIFKIFSEKFGGIK
jgi:hypothetical protein